MRKVNSPHISVMLEEFLAYFSGQEIKCFFEGTVGAGGHAHSLLKAHPEIEKYIGCDRDPVALELASDTLASWKDRIELVHADFRDLDGILEDRGIKEVDGFFLT